MFNVSHPKAALKNKKKVLRFPPRSNHICKTQDAAQEKEVAAVVLRLADVHQVWFYHNQLSIAQDSSTIRDSKP